MMIEDALTNPYKELTLPETSEMYDRLENPDEDMKEISQTKKRQKSYFERLKSKVK